MYFVIFFQIFPILENRITYRASATSALRALAADSQPFSLYLGNKTTFCFSIKKILHNRFPYISLYQLNIIFLLLFSSFSLFPTFSLFLISINYISFILK